MGFNSARKRNKAVTGQAAFCLMLMDRIKGNVDGRESLRSSLNTFPSYGYGGLERQHTKTAIQREITELRAALLELSKMLEV